MLKFVVRRLLLLVPILVGLSILVFAWVRALPGGPEAALLGERATPERVAAVRHEFGLDQPIYQQYFKYIGHVATGDFGQSLKTNRSVLGDIQVKFPATIELALAALLFAVAVGIPLGFIAARRYQTWADSSTIVGSLLGISVPVFFLAYLLKYLFAVKLHWLPRTPYWRATGAPSPTRCDIWFSQESHSARSRWPSSRGSPELLCSR